MKHDPCTECGYLIHHDEECPGCAREWMDGQLTASESELATLKRQHEQLRAAAERLYRAHNERAFNGTALEAVRVALDATPGEPPPPNTSYEQLRAAAELALGAWNNVKARDALRAALDATPAETDPLSKQVFDPYYVRELGKEIEGRSALLKLEGLIEIVKAWMRVKDSEKK